MFGTADTWTCVGTASWRVGVERSSTTFPFKTRSTEIKARDAFSSSRAARGREPLSDAVAVAVRGGVEAFVEGHRCVEAGDGVLAGEEVVKQLPCRIGVVFSVEKVVEAVALVPAVTDVVDFVDIGVSR